MVSNFDFIRRFTTQAQQVARFVAFDFEVDVHVTEEEIFEELRTRGYGAA